MSAAAPRAIAPDEGNAAPWRLAALIAAGAHLLAAVGILAWTRPVAPPVPEPVVLVELPAEAGPAPAAAATRAVTRPEPSQAVAPQPVASPLDAAPIRAPLPHDPVTLPVAALPPPARQAAPAPVTPAVTPSPTAVSPTGAGSGTSRAPGADPRAKAAEVDYFSLISAHLNRRKTYPVEARKARQEGVVTIRFTVDRGGNVSAASVKRSSGHELLDQATLALLQRVAPLPRMPAAMQRDSVTLALPIEYSLKTS